MKYLSLLYPLILGSCLFFTFPLDAQIESQSIGDEHLIKPQSLHPFSFNFSADRTGASDLTKKHKHHDHFEDRTLKYTQANATLEGTFYYNPKCVEGAIATAGYSYTRFQWANPFFDQTDFNTLTVSIKGFSGRCDGWFWQGQIAANFDLDNFDFNHYTTFDMLLWGRYNVRYCPGWGVHVGILAQTGMRDDRVYPVLGFDWQYSPKLKINMVVPLNVSAIYTLNENWSAGIGGRFFDTRHRTGKDQPLPEAIIAYRTIGAEALINYTNCDWAEGNIHAGWILTGKLKISNRRQEHGKWFDVGGAPYLGASGVIKF